MDNIVEQTFACVNNQHWILLLGFIKYFFKLKLTSALSNTFYDNAHTSACHKVFNVEKYPFLSSNLEYNIILFWTGNKIQFLIAIFLINFNTNSSNICGMLNILSKLAYVMQHIELYMMRTQFILKGPEFYTIIINCKSRIFFVHDIRCLNR